MTGSGILIAFGLKYFNHAFGKLFGGRLSLHNHKLENKASVLSIISSITRAISRNTYMLLPATSLNLIEVRISMKSFFFAFFLEIDPS